MDEDGGANIYEDLPDFRYDKTLDQLHATIAKLEAENHFLQSRLVEVTEEKNVLEADCRVLNTNISSLLKTAKLEIKRKERDIANLREQLNEVRPQKRQFGTKRRRETIATPSPRKKPKFSPRKVPEMRKFSPRKVREERLTSCIKDSESSSKRKVREISTRAERATFGKRASRDDKTARDERPNRFETERRDHPVTGKENAPIKDASVSKESQVNENSAASSENLVDPSPAIAAPSLPALQCPTVFSVRMFNRIYGRKCENALPTLTAKPSGSADSIQPSVDGEPQKPRTVNELHPSGSSNQRPSSSNCCRVTPEDIGMYLGVEDSLNSDSSQSTASIHLEVKPVASSYVKPQNVNAKISLKVTEADLNPEHQKHAELPLKKLEAPIHQPTAVEPHSVPSMPPEDNPGHQKHVELPLKKVEVPINQPPAIPSVPPVEEPEHQKRTELPLKQLEVPVHQPPVIEPHSVPPIPPEGTKEAEVNLEQPSAKSPPAKIGLLAVGKPRQQMVAAIRPIQKLATQEIPAVVGESSNEISPKSEMTEIKTGVRSAEKSSRHLKIPGLSGSAKGRTARQVFVPISNQWNSSHPGAGNQNDSDQKCCSELPIVKTVSMTSELTVRVEDPKFDELKKQSSTEALFGSPVKWADDSLDSPMTEGSANARRLYSIFGSPLKSFDSNSSEHPFSVSPAAYEDSCWTNQVPEKMPTNSSAEDANLQKQSQRSLELVTETETKPKEKSLKQYETEKATTRSFFPPPPLSVIKKHVSIFSPVKGSNTPVTSSVPDEPSRSNTGICFPFPRPAYEDSVLGQFDDTAQFVSALAKVDTQISPLSTPIKSGEGSNHSRSVIVEKNPTSFQQVFKQSGPEGTHQILEPPNLEKHTVGVISAKIHNPPVLPEVSSNEDHAERASNQCVFSRHSSDEDHEISNRNETIDSAENPKPQKIVEPPTIKITPPKTESSVRLIHRPNFASSAMLSVKSWFPDAPVKMVTPRKTPRLVSRVNRSASPKGLEVSAGARIAIDDAFIIEQEERVRRWELDLYENTRSGSGSPMKSANESLIHKRVESPGKISPSKRSPKKQNSPCKSYRRAEVHRDVVVAPALQCNSDAVTAFSSSSNKDTTLNQLVPRSANQTDTAAYSVDAISSQILTEPINSVPNSTQKVLTMIDAVMQKNAESGFESSLAEGKKPEDSVDVTSMGAKSRVEDKDTSVDKTKSSDCFGPEPPSGSTLKQIVPSLVAVSDHTPCSGAVGKEACLKNSTNEPAVFATPPDSDVSCRIPPSSTPLPFCDKSVPHPIEAALSLRDSVPEYREAKASKISPDPPIEVKANGNKKQRIAVQRRIDSTASTPIAPSKSTGSSECHANTANQATSNGGPIRKKVPSSSKYAAISRVKPSTPLNKAVAALLSCSTSKSKSKSSASSRPRQSITPVVQSTKKFAFKRSSALKSDTKKNAGNNLMNSIKSTFFPGNSGIETQTPRPKLIRRKSEPNLSVNSTNTVSVKSTTRNPVVAPSLKKHPTTADDAGSRGPAVTVAQDGLAVSKTALDDTIGRYDRAHLKAPAVSVVRDSVTLSKKPPDQDCNISGQWKLLEVDHHTKPISLLQRFKESKEGLLHPLDSMPKEKSNAQTDEPKVENDTKSSAAQPSVLNGAVEIIHQGKPDTQHIPEPNGLKVLNRDGDKFPPKGSFFPRSCRRTILLDSPLKMETPTKVTKRRWEPIETPKPKEKCGESSKSSKSKEKCVEPKSGKKARTASGGRVTPENTKTYRRTSQKKSNKEARSRGVTPENTSQRKSNKEARSRGVTPENTSPKECNKKLAEPRKSRVDSPGKSRYSRHRLRDRSRDHRSRDKSRDHRSRDKSRDHRSRDKSRGHRSRDKSRGHRSRDRSRSISPRRSRRKNRDVSPKPRTKYRSSSCDSPERFPTRKSSQSSGRKSKVPTKKSAGGKSEAGNQESPERKSKTVSSKSAGKPQSKNSAAESVAKRSSSSDSACGSSKISPSESADENPKIARPESVDDAPFVKITASAPRQKTAAVANSNDAKVNSAQPQNSEPPRYTDFCTSAGIPSSTPRIQAGATPATSSPALVVRGNRKLNFSSAPASSQTEIVISAGKRPALFSRSS